MAYINFFFQLHMSCTAKFHETFNTGINSLSTIGINVLYFHFEHSKMNVRVLTTQ